MKKTTVNSVNKISNDYLKNGYVILPIKNLYSFNKMEKSILKIIHSTLSANKIKINSDFTFDNFHKYISLNLLNKLRLEIINKMINLNSLRDLYYNIFQEYLDIIVGNEIMMQRRVNLSIQIPKDNSSLLHIHTDTWSGDSPFEVVGWLPFVNCYNSKSMYILPKKKNDIIFKQMVNKKFKGNNNSIYKKVKKDLIWLNIKKGNLLLFNQNLLHGNIVNSENETRWSMNCRFKSVFSPYYQKEIGEFFQPFKLRPATIDGLKYRQIIEDAKS